MGGSMTVPVIVVYSFAHGKHSAWGKHLGQCKGDLRNRTNGHLHERQMLPLNFDGPDLN